MPRRRVVGMRMFEARPRDTKFVRMSYSMLESPTFMSLSYTAMILYIYMRKRSGGNEDIEYAISYGVLQSPIKSKATVDKAIDELVEKGFLIITRFSTGGGHRPRAFKFSHKWIDNEARYS